jgi:hypothetical protein
MSPTRRTILQGLAALPVAAVPAIAATHPDAALLAPRPEIEAVHAVCQALVSRISAAETLKYAGQPSPDLRAAEAAQDAANAVWSDMRDVIEAMPARTLDGLRFKAMVADQNDCSDPYLLQSIVADLLAMDGGAHG